jgi:hypothetical protein
MAKAIPAGWLYDWEERKTEEGVYDWFKLGPNPPQSDAFMRVDAMEPVYTHINVVDDFGNLMPVLIEKLGF